MSKKIIKRSLALGALMAFVITGSAMAGTITSDNNIASNTIHGETFTLAEQHVTLRHTGIGPVIGYYQWGDNPTNPSMTTVNINSEEILELFGNDNGSYNYFGLIQNTNIIGNGTVILNQEGKGSTAIGGNYLTNGNNVTIDVDKIVVDNKDGYGVWSNANTDINLFAKDINISAGDVAVYGAGANITIKATEKLIISSNNGSNGDVIYANSNSVVDIGSGQGVDKADIIITGNVYTVGSNAELNIALETAGSSITGVINEHPQYNASDDRSKLTLSEGATWNVTGESKVTELNGSNGNVKVDSLQAGLVKVETNQAENLTVTGSGNVADAIAAGEDGASLAALANTVQNNTGGAIADVIATEEGNIAGAMSAEVVKNENGEAVFNEDGTVALTNQKTAVNTTNASLADNAVALKAHWRTHMNDMNKRMGELRNANGEHGVWVRMVRGENEYDNNKAQYNQYQLGYDEKLSVDKRWTVGAAVTFAEGDSSYGKGTTEDDSTAFAIYGSKLNNDGTFVDLIARYARMESDITSNKGEFGDYSTNGYSVSAEFGKRIQQGKGLWIEPQVELTCGTVDSAEYVIGNKKVHLDSMDSFIARAGFAIGKDIKQGNVYARASYLYDFDGEADSYVTAASGGSAVSPHEDDLGGGWWEVGVGANINLSKSTYIYADVEKTFGGEVDTNWQWNLGVRYSF